MEESTASGGRSTATSSMNATVGLWPGTRVGHYVLQHELGRGGMGTVFLARDSKLDRQVAIKFVVMTAPGAVARFMAEARVTARCTHPNIVVIHEISEHAGVPYTVLEYVQGESVSARLRGGPMPPARVAAIMTQVARAIAAAHARGIIHRDLKPANILLGSDGGVKVVDFGIAKYVDRLELTYEPGARPGSAPGDDHARDLTAADELVGTLHYLAPEQIRREAVDARVDLWGFGVTMFQMLAGKRPFDGLSRGEVVERLKDLDESMPRLDLVAPGTPPALVEIVHRCLAKRVEQRMASAAELVAALEALPPPSGVGAVVEADTTERLRGVGVGAGDAGSDAGSDTAPPTRRHLWPRHLRQVMAALALAAAIAAGAVWKLRRGRDHGERGNAIATAAAASRVTALFAEIDRLDRRGQRDEARRLYDAFVDEERDAEAVALAWLGRADRERDRGDLEAALDTYAGGYARAGDPEVQRRALIEVGDLYRRRWEWDRLAAALDVLDRMPGPRHPRGEALREHLRLVTRDPAAARGLLAGRRADLTASSVVTADVDGDGDADLVTLEGGDLVARTAVTRRELTRRPAPGLTSLRCVGRDVGGAWAVAAPTTTSAGDWQLLDLAGGAPPVAIDPLVPGKRGRCHWIDLDGDHRNELYLVIDNGLARLHQEAAPGQLPGLAAPWIAHRDAMGSQVADLVGGDLDGDGRAELVIALGEWRAYDVRVMRAGPGGSLRLDDRVRLGTVSNLASLGRDRDGRGLIAALKEDTYPSIRMLPSEHPLGAPAGLYVLALGPRGLEIVRRVDVPSPPQPDITFGALIPGDLDGDGHRDLVAAASISEEGSDMVVMRGRADGGFDVGVIGGATPIGTLDSDGDAAAELLVRLDGSPLPWILGEGDVAVPRVDIMLVPDQPPSPAARRDAAMAGAWRRAEELARIGRVEAAVAALRRIATVAPDHQTRADALGRAGALLRARALPAATIYEALAGLEPVGSRARLDALLVAIDEYAARLEVHDVRRLIDEASGATAITSGERGRLAALRDQLRVAPIALFDGDVLASPWRVVDPTLVHVVPGSRRLTVETLVPGVVASVPLVRAGELVTLALDAEVTRTEWAGGLRVRLGPRDRTAPGAIYFEVGGRGGGGIYERRQLCGFAADAWQRTTPLPDTDQDDRIHVEIVLRPSQRRARCTILSGGRTESSTLDGAGAPDLDIDWELSIEGGADAAMTSATVRFAAITVAGFELAPGSPDALDGAALALANHRSAEARTVLTRGPGTTTWAARRLAVVAGDETGDRSGAVAALAGARSAAAAQRPSAAEVARLIRARDGQFTPVVRSALGSRLAPVMEAAWVTVAHHDLDEPRVRTAVIRDASALPPPTRATAAATLTLGGYLGEALLAVGRPDDGRRALEDALALLPRDPPPPLRDRAERICHLLAVEAATRGDDVAARAWGLRALEVSSFPELAADQLLQHPATRALAADPSWARVVELGRPLAGAPGRP